MPTFSRRGFLNSCAAVAGGLTPLQILSGQAGADIHVCPKSKPPARTINVMRLEELTSHAWDMRLTLTCLQGIVNRSQPRLYLIQDRYDELWLEWLRERGDVEKIEWLEVGQVFERFLPEVKGMVVIDPAIPGSINAATMVAAVKGWLVASPATAAQYDLPSGSLPDSCSTCA